MAQVDPTDELITGLYVLLNNTITYGSQTYKFYTSVPVDIPYNYIYLEGIEAEEDSTKDKISYDVSVTLEIAIEHKKRATFQTVNNISNDLLDLIYNTGITLTNFHFWELPTVGTFGQFLEQQSQKLITRKVIVLNMRIGQN
jgi:hypothetical protein